MEKSLRGRLILLRTGTEDETTESSIRNSRGGDLRFDPLPSITEQLMVFRWRTIIDRLNPGTRKEFFINSCIYESLCFCSRDRSPSTVKQHQLYESYETHHSLDTLFSFYYCLHSSRWYLPVSELIEFKKLFYEVPYFIFGPSFRVTWSVSGQECRISLR